MINTLPLRWPGEWFAHHIGGTILAGKKFELQAGLAHEHVDAGNYGAVASAGLFYQKRVFGIVNRVENDHRGAEMVLVVGRFIHVRMHSYGSAVKQHICGDRLPGVPIDGTAIEVFRKRSGLPQHSVAHDDLHAEAAQAIDNRLAHAAGPEHQGGLAVKQISGFASGLLCAGLPLGCSWPRYSRCCSRAVSGRRRSPYS